MTHLIKFLKSQKLLILATHDESGVWAFRAKEFKFTRK